MIHRLFRVLWAVAAAWAFFASAFMYAATKSDPYFAETYLFFAIVAAGPLAIVAIAHYVMQPKRY